MSVVDTATLSESDVWVRPSMAAILKALKSAFPIINGVGLWSKEFRIDLHIKRGIKKDGTIFIR
jgi:hypothetical protein